MNTEDYTLDTASITELTEQLNEAHSQVMELVADNSTVREELERTRAQYLALTSEGAGWQAIYGTGFSRDENSGLSLDTLKTVSKLLREEISSSALPKRANEARYSHTFGKGFIIPGFEEEILTPDEREKPRRGRPRKRPLTDFMASDTIKRYVWSEEAQVAMHAASSTDGCFLLLGNDTTKEVHPISILEIDDVMTDPDFVDEVWAYKRKWNSFNPATGTTENKELWIYTDRYKGARLTTVGDTPVAKDLTIIDAVFNNQVGWTLGVPDLMAGQIWNRKYLTMIAYGEAVTEALATYTAKIKAQSQAGANAMGLKMSKGGVRAGHTHVYGAGNEITTFQTAGRTYDFGGLRVFAAFYAASVGLPLTDLTADPSAAGASYGSAAALMPGARRSIEARRLQWADWMSRVIKWGIGRDVDVIPESILEEDAYRKTQATIMSWATGNFHPDEIRPALAKTTDIQLLHERSPEGVVIPNNEAQLEPANDGVTVGSDGSAITPDQGVQNGTGGQDDKTKKDLRRDTISNNTESLAQMLLRNDLLEEKVNQLANLVEELVVNLNK